MSGNIWFLNYTISSLVALKDTIHVSVVSGLYRTNYFDNLLTETIRNQYHNTVIIGKKINDKTVTTVH